MKFSTDTEIRIIDCFSSFPKCWVDCIPALIIFPPNTKAILMKGMGSCVVKTHNFNLFYTILFFKRMQLKKF